MIRTQKNQSVLITIMNMHGKIAKRLSLQERQRAILNVIMPIKSFCYNLSLYLLETKKSILKHKLKQRRQRITKISLKKLKRNPDRNTVKVSSQFFVTMLDLRNLLFKTHWKRKVKKVENNGYSNQHTTNSSFASLISKMMLTSAFLQKA